MPGLTDVVECPRCYGALREAEAGLACADCHRTYPKIGGVPVLFEDPGDWIDQWRAQAHEFTLENKNVRNKLLAQSTGVELTDLTRKRLETLRTHLGEHAQRLTRLLGDAGIEPKARTAAAVQRVPGEGTITAYYHQLHRDWGWSPDVNRENALALDAVAEVVDGPLGTLLVLGAGGCRLTYDLCMRNGVDLAIAVDINPLPFIVARRLFAGEAVDLFEFPLRPRTTDLVCVDRRMRAPGPYDRIELLFADGEKPPVRAGSIDTVLTPWFIDQVPHDMAELFPEINAALRDGGTWLNFGPLIYHPNHTGLAQRYCVDETLDLVAGSGFRVDNHTFQRLPYMESPAGSQGRTEHLLTFRATKTGAAAKPRARTPEPGWLADPSAPIPRLAGLDTYAAPHAMFAAIVQLIDGQRSAREIADNLIDKHSLPAAAALGGVQACLAEIVRALQDTVE